MYRLLGFAGATPPSPQRPEQASSAGLDGRRACEKLMGYTYLGSTVQELVGGQQATNKTVREVCNAQVVGW